MGGFYCHHHGKTYSNGIYHYSLTIMLDSAASLSFLAESSAFNFERRDASIALSIDSVSELNPVNLIMRFVTFPFSALAARPTSVALTFAPTSPFSELP